MTISTLLSKLGVKVPEKYHVMPDLIKGDIISNRECHRQGFNHGIDKLLSLEIPEPIIPELIELHTKNLLEAYEGIEMTDVQKDKFIEALKRIGWRIL